MIAMQYGVTLPSDYDMDIIRRRIADKGHLMDDYPGLAFKAYLYATRDDDALHATDNQYAPFYLWHADESMNAFLSGPGFAGLARDFGRPAVHTWLAWQATLFGDPSAAGYASRQVTPLRPHVDLNRHRQAEANRVRADGDLGALAAITAFDPTHWTQVRFRLWPEHPPVDTHDAQLYRVGHVSRPSGKP